MLFGETELEAWEGGWSELEVWVGKVDGAFMYHYASV